MGRGEAGMAEERERIAGFGRLEDGLRQSGPWYQWGPYLSERQWGTVREDYSSDGDAWSYLPHDHARSRAYRWGEDGLAGFCDIEQRLCLAPTPGPTPSFCMSCQRCGTVTRGPGIPQRLRRHSMPPPEGP